MVRKAKNIGPGTEVVYEGRTYTVSYLLHPEAGLEAGDGTVIAAPINALVLPKAESKTEGVTVYAEQPDPRDEEANRRYELIEPAILGNLSVEECARQTNISRSTAYRYLAKFLAMGAKSALKRKVYKNKGQHHHPAYDYTYKRFLKGRRQYKRGLALTIYKKLKQLAKREGFTVPALSTIRKWVCEAKTEADQIAPLDLGGEPSSTLDYWPDIPFYIIQIDHTMLRIMLVDDEGNVLGQPWLTVAIDVATRMVVGWYLTLDPPSRMSIAMTLDMVALPNSYLRHKYGLSDVPCGKFMIFHADNAGEMRTEGLHEGLNYHGSSVYWRAVGKPQHGAYVERFMGTFKLLMTQEEIPGNYRYDATEAEKRRAEKLATHTLGSAERLAVDLFSKYHHKTHSSLGLSPLKQYQNLLDNSASGEPGLGGVQRYSNPEHFRIAVLPKLREDKALHPGGIVVDKFWYHSFALDTYIRQYQRDKVKLEVRLSHHDLSKIYVRISKDKFLTVRTKERYPPFSRNELNAAHATLDAKGIPRRARDQVLLHKTILKNRRRAAQPKVKKPRGQRRKDVSETANKERAKKMDKKPIRRGLKANAIPAVEVIPDEEENE